MKYHMLTIGLIFQLLAVHGHDFKMAHYTIHRVDQSIFCDIRIDIDDFKAAMGMAIDQDRVEHYLKQHLHFVFDGDSVAFSRVEHIIAEHWIKIRVTLDTKITEPDQVAVYNDLLIGKIADHDNLMRFIFHDRTRVFRLNQKNHQISFSYKPES